MNPDPEFDPEDIKDIEAAFARVENENHNGYRMEFYLSRETAIDMVTEWSEALMGNRDASNMCWSRYSYIMGEIISALDEFG